MEYFSDKEEFNDRNYLLEDISIDVWNGIATLVKALIDNNNLAKDYPIQCPDGNGVWRVDEQSFYVGAKSVIPTIDILLNYSDKVALFPPHILPSTWKNVPWEDNSCGENSYENQSQFKYDVLDFIEFVFKHISDVERDKYHDYYKHYELTFPNTTLAQEKFINDVNEIFQRNNVAFKLCSNGEIQRIIDENLNNLINESVEPQEETLKNLLNIAKTKIKSPKFEERKIALEKLWDAFERIKTVIDFNNKNKNKKESANKLLEKCADGNDKMKEVLDNECRELTKIGNEFFIIRHSEMDKLPLDSSEHIDYLFFRMFSLMQLLLTKI
ncbi:MAG: hypothetical protein IKS33_07960 [Bacteroidales bacterium]|nr:hypothetical protein [Bacteroidales bacterium]